VRERSKNRPSYSRDKLRYPSDVTDAARAHIKPLVPLTTSGYGKQGVDKRPVVDGVLYVLSTRCSDAKYSRIRRHAAGCRPSGA